MYVQEGPTTPIDDTEETQEDNDIALIANTLNIYIALNGVLEHNYDVEMSTTR